MYVDVLIRFGFKRGDYVSQFSCGLPSTKDFNSSGIEMNGAGPSTFQHLLDSHAGCKAAKLTGGLACNTAKRSPILAPSRQVGKQPRRQTRVTSSVLSQERLGHRRKVRGHSGRPGVRPTAELVPPSEGDYVARAHRLFA